MSKYASHIHAFEPWSKVRQAIDEKITRNRLTNVTVHPVALGEEHQFVPFYAPQGGNWAQALSMKSMRQTETGFGATSKL